MIRFVCEHCGKPVRVPEAFAGKKGRCPFCKAVVHIPPPAAASGGGDAAAELAAALAGAGRDESPPPRPPSRIEDVAEPTEPELDLASATDPKSKTDRLRAIEDGGVIDFADEAEESAAAAATSREPTPMEQARAAQRARAEAIKAAKKRRMLIGGAVLLVLIVAGGIVALVWKPWKKPEPAPSRPPQVREAPAAVLKRAAPARRPRPRTTAIPAPAPTPTPPPALDPKPAPTATEQFALSPELLAVTERAPDGAFFLLHVDLRRTARGMAKVSASRVPMVAEVAASKLWTKATSRIRDGAMPASGTLFLAGGSPVEISRMFGKLYGQRPGSAAPGATSGLWSLAEDDAPVPHVLLRLTGTAARNLSADLLGRATALKLEGTFQADKPASHGVLRLAPAGLSGMDDTGEMLVGTAETIDEAGRCKVNRAQQERIRALLTEVPTEGQAIVGCAKLPALRACVGSALGVAMTGPAWEGPQTALVFSIDPEPRGKATILLSQPPAGSLEKVAEHAGSLRASEEGGDIRLEGPGPAGLAALADFLPGFRLVAIKALAMAKPVPARGTVAARPKATRKPPGPRPAGQRRLPFLCFYNHCPTRKGVFFITTDKVPPTVMAGTEAMLCPNCGKKQAVVAVRCPKCMAWSPQTVENCEQCRRPLRSMGPKPADPSAKPAPKTP